MEQTMKIMKRICVISLLCFVSINAQTFTPCQFIAKLYTECLGRAPDPDGWIFWQNVFNRYPKDAATLKLVATAFFTSPEYNNLGYNNSEKVMTLYRALLNRDIGSLDQSMWESWTDALNRNRLTWNDAINFFTGCPEFTTMQGAIFNGGSYGWNGSDGLDGHVASTFPISIRNPQVPPGVTLFTGTTGDELQRALDNAAYEVVCAPQLVISCSRTLRIPANKKLSTYQPASKKFPNASRYASFARLVRATALGAPGPWPMVVLESTATIEYVLLDGGRSYWGRMTDLNYNIYAETQNPVNSPSGVIISHCKLTNTPCGGNLFVGGSNNQVKENLITGYENRHFTADISAGINNENDGITCQARGWTSIEGNGIVDVTDVGIVHFGLPEYVHNTQIRNNTIVVAGSGIMSCIALDGIPNYINLPGNRNFSGCQVYNNTILAGNGPRVHADIVFSVNSRAWFGAPHHLFSDASRVRIQQNTVYPIKCSVGILVSDATNVTVTNNIFTINGVFSLSPTVPLPTCNLPQANVVLVTNTNTNCEIQELHSKQEFTAIWNPTPKQFPHDPINPPPVIPPRWECSFVDNKIFENHLEN
jgi:hypothetical protein